jgi:TRAP-type transport system periplasmic protein
MSKRLSVIVLISIALLFTGVVSAFAQPMNWKVVGLNRATPQFKPFEWFAQELEKRSKGQVTTDLLSIPELGLTGFELVRVMKAGLVDAADMLPAYVAGDVPIIEAVDLPGLYADLETAIKAHEKFIPAFQKYEDKVGGVVLGIYLWPHQVIWSRKPIRSLDDMKGLKVRVYGTAQTEFLKALGAVPVSVAFAEVYTALERGTVDAAITGTYSGYALKWYEVSKYMVEMNLGPVTGLLVISKRSWDKASKELQATLRQMGQEFTQQGLEVGRRTTQEGIDESKKKGIEFINPGKAALDGAKQVVADTVIPGWVKRAGGEPAKALFNEYVAPYAGQKIQ